MQKPEPCFGFLEKNASVGVNCLSLGFDQIVESAILLYCLLSRMASTIPFYPVCFLRSMLYRYTLDHSGRIRANVVSFIHHYKTSLEIRGCWLQYFAPVYKSFCKSHRCHNCFFET